MSCKEGTKTTRRFRKLKRKVVNPTILETTSGIISTERSWRSHRRQREKLMSHCNLVHKSILIPQAMKIADAKAAVDKEWKKLKPIPAWQLDKVKSKKEVVLKAQRDKKKVHFATLVMRSQNQTTQSTEGRVVFRSDLVKDDSCSYAVLTEQSSSASPMTAAKVMDAQKFVERYCELARKKDRAVFFLKKKKFQVFALMIIISRRRIWISWRIFTVCSQIVLKCLYWKDNTSKDPFSQCEQLQGITRNSHTGEKWIRGNTDDDWVNDTKQNNKHSNMFNVAANLLHVNTYEYTNWRFVSALCLFVLYVSL